jgi:hypothetical protein
MEQQVAEPMPGWGCSNEGIGQSQSGLGQPSQPEWHLTGSSVLNSSALEKRQIVENQRVTQERAIQQRYSSSQQNQR